MVRTRIMPSLVLFLHFACAIVVVKSEVPEEFESPKRFATKVPNPKHRSQSAQVEFGNGLSIENQIQSPERVYVPWSTSDINYNYYPKGQTLESPPLHPIRDLTSGLSHDSLSHAKRKRSCSIPVLTRRLVGPVMKRAQRNLPYFANSENEVQQKNLEDDESESRVKRSDSTDSGGCLAKRQWLDIGAEYYPRYVKTYHCSTNTCDRGFGELGECKPKHYNTKVLKRITPLDATSEEDCDPTLPESLRFNWKLVSVKVVTCCDCVSPGSIFGLK